MTASHLSVCAVRWFRLGPKVLAAGLVFTGAGALAQPAVDPLQDAGVLIKGFQVMGDNPLPDEETTHVLASFLRKPASVQALQQATTALESAMAAKGHALHRVILPPQELGDVVRFEIVRFSIGTVTVTGAQRYDADNVRRSLPELQEGGAPNFHRLALQTALANENPGKQTQVSFREGTEPDRIDATVAVAELGPVQWLLGLANTGAASSGRDRFTVAAGHANLWGRDHQLNAAYTTSLARAGDVSQLGVSYRLPFYAAAGMLGMSYTRSDVVGSFGTFTSTGAGHTLGLSYTQYLPVDGGRRAWWTAALDDKVYDVAHINDIAVPGQRMRRSRPLTLSYAARHEAEGRFLAYNLDLALNLSGGSGNDAAAYASEDPRVKSARWRALRGSVSYAFSLPAQWQMVARTQFQHSNQALISGEQFGLGGAGSVRGVPERALSGDRGVLASMEITSPELAKGLRWATFVDGGWLGNVTPVSVTRPGSDRLASAGLGLRYAAMGFVVTADYARVITGSVVPLTLNPTAPRRGDQKLHINLLARF